MKDKIPFSWKFGGVCFLVFFMVGVDSSVQKHYRDIKRLRKVSIEQDVHIQKLVKIVNWLKEDHTHRYYDNRPVGSKEKNGKIHAQKK